MGTIYTVEGNTSAGSTLVANGGGVAKKSYSSSYARIAVIWRPKYKSGEAKKVVSQAEKYIGYLEKKTNADLEDFTKNAGYNNYNMFAPHAKSKTGSGVYVNGVAWCDIFVDDMLIRALGVNRAKALLGGWSAYTPTSSNYLKNAGATKITDFSKAEGGDIIFFKDNSGGICHTGIVVNKNASTPAAPSTYTQKDFINDVCKILGVKTAKDALKKTVTISTTSNSTHALVSPIQKYLKALGYYKGAVDKQFGSLCKDAVITYQAKVVKASKANQDGIVTAKAATWKKLLGL
jgi:hypothetical protein